MTKIMFSFGRQLNTDTIEILVNDALYSKILNKDYDSLFKTFVLSTEYQILTPDETALVLGIMRHAYNIPIDTPIPVKYVYGERSKQIYKYGYLLTI